MKDFEQIIHKKKKQLMTNETMFHLTYKAKKLANFLLAKTTFLRIKLARTIK